MFKCLKQFRMIYYSQRTKMGSWEYSQSVYLCIPRSITRSDPTKFINKNNGNIHSFNYL